MTAAHVGAPLGPNDVAEPIGLGDEGDEHAEALKLDRAVEGVKRPISTRGLIGIGVVVLICTIAILDGLNLIHVDLGIDYLFKHDSTVAVAAAHTPVPFNGAPSGGDSNDGALAGILRASPTPSASSVPANGGASPGPVAIRGLHGAGGVATTNASALAAPTANPFPVAGNTVPNLDVSGPQATYVPVSPSPGTSAESGAADLSRSGRPDPADQARSSEIAPAIAIAAAIDQVEHSNTGGRPNQIANGAGSASDGGVPATPQQKSAVTYDRTTAGGYLNATRQPALSRYEIWPGRYLRMLLDTAIIVDLPGQVCAHLLEPAMDSQSATVVLMPERTEVCGRYNTIVAGGASRIQVAWTQATFPDGSTLDLGGMGSADRSGWSGLSADVNNHTGAVIGSTLLTTVLAGVLAAANPAASTGLGAAQTPGQAAGQQILQTGTNIVNQKVSLPPTLSLKKSTDIMLSVDRAIVLPPYHPVPALDSRQ